MTFERITVEPDEMGGLPCIRGLRIPVATVVVMVADGMSPEQIVDGASRLGSRRRSRSASVRG